MTDDKRVKWDKRDMEGRQGKFCIHLIQSFAYKFSSKIKSNVFVYYVCRAELS